MFRNSNRRVTFATARAAGAGTHQHYAVRAARRYQIIAESICSPRARLVTQKYEQLKAFQAEGLFDQQHKQPLPSPGPLCRGDHLETGAALHDILHVLKRRDPSLPAVSADGGRGRRRAGADRSCYRTGERARRM